MYSDQPEGTVAGQPPLLLVHSVNAAASAAEIAPLFAHYRRQRAVYALELPGFGFSDRSDRPYTPRLMTDALHAAIAIIQAEQGGTAVDVLAVSLAGEFAARAKCEAPHSIRRLALVSPTGFRGAKLRYGRAGSTLGMPWLYRLFTWNGWRQGIFNTLTRPGVVRYFCSALGAARPLTKRCGAIAYTPPGSLERPTRPFILCRLFCSVPTSTPCTKRSTARSG